MPGFHVEPIPHCVHCEGIALCDNAVLDINAPCSSCGNVGENMQCLTCFTVLCGRHVQGHMLAHHDATQHPIVMGFLDLSTWCYPCEAYIAPSNPRIRGIRGLMHTSKFGVPPAGPPALDYNNPLAGLVARQGAACTTAAEIAALLEGKQRVCFFTGAGVSVESGIPPFRIPKPEGAAASAGSDAAGDAAAAALPAVAATGSIWGTFDAAKMTVHNFNTDPAITKSWWAMKHDLVPKCLAAQPNPAHLFPKQLQDAGRLSAVVTQNIDSLHHASGVAGSKILELHGHMRGIICSNHRTPLNPVPCKDGACTFAMPHEACLASQYCAADPLPQCPACGCPLRTETVMFEQPMPWGVMEQAEDAMKACDFLFVVGTSLIVQPANGLPAVALRAGIPVVIVNLHGTQYDRFVQGVVRGSAAAFFRELGQLVAQRQQQQPPPRE